MRRYILSLVFGIVTGCMMAADYTVCKGEYVTLTAPCEGDFYTWKKGSSVLTDSTKSSIKVKVTEAANYSCLVEIIDPQLEDNMMGNGSFETPPIGDAKPFPSSYKYPNSSQGGGWDPEDYYAKSGHFGNGFYVITSNAQKMWRNYISLPADHENYYALFDAASSGEAWSATTTAGNPDLKVQSGKEYTFSFSAANINRHKNNSGTDATPTAADLTSMTKSGYRLFVMRMDDPCNPVVWIPLGATKTDQSKWIYFQELPGFNGWYYVYLPASNAKGYFYQLSDNREYNAAYTVPTGNMSFTSNAQLETTTTADNSIYFTNNNNWGDVYVYGWEDGTGNKFYGGWPGTKVTTVEGGKYKIAIPSGTPNSNWKIIWSCGNSGCQTGNLSFEAGATYNTSGIESHGSASETYIHVTGTPAIATAGNWNSKPCYSGWNNVDVAPAKLQFTITNMNNTSQKEVLGTIDLNCAAAQTHGWIRHQFVWKSTWSSTNVKIAVENITSATMGNDFGLDRIMFQAKDNTHRATKCSGTYTVDVHLQPAGTVAPLGTIASSATSFDLQLSGLSNASYYQIALPSGLSSTPTTTPVAIPVSNKITVNIGAGAANSGNITLTLWNSDKSCSTDITVPYTIASDCGITVSDAGICANETQVELPITSTTGTPTKYELSFSGTGSHFADGVYTPAGGKFTISTNGTPADVYTVNIKVYDSTNAVSSTATATITINALPEITIGSIADIAYNGGSVTIPYTRPAGSTATTYSATAEGKTATGTLAATGNIVITGLGTLSAGSHSVSVTVKSDADCQQTYSTATFNVIEEPIVSVSNPSALTECADATDFTIALNSTHGAAKYKINFDGGLFTPVTSWTAIPAAGITIQTNGTPAGSYTATLVVCDETETAQSTLTMTLTIKAKPAGTVAPLGTIASSATSFDLQLSGLSNASYYQIALPSGLSSTPTTTPVAIPVSNKITVNIGAGAANSGTITLTLWNSDKSCSTDITVPYTIAADCGITVSNAGICANETQVELPITSTTGTPTKYELSFSGTGSHFADGVYTPAGGKFTIPTNGTPADVYTVNIKVYDSTNAVSSTATATITINQPTTGDEYQTACSSYTWHGNTYDASGNYTWSTTNAQGCDSTATLHLTINKSYKVDTTAVECDSFTWHGVTYMSTPTEAPTHNYGTAAGCDSIVTLYLTVNKSKTSEEIVRNCGAYTWEGVEYTISGDYTETLVAANGCDSVVTLHLMVLNDSLMYTKWGNLVLCADRNRDLKSYQWFINGAEVSGATGQYMLTDDMTALISVRAITQSGDTLYSCEKTFAEMTTSPDQSKEEYTLPKNAPVRVYTISGRLMGTAEDNVGDVVSHLPAGIYILRWEDRAVRWVVY